MTRDVRISSSWWCWKVSDEQRNAWSCSNWPPAHRIHRSFTVKHIYRVGRKRCVIISVCGHPNKQHYGSWHVRPSVRPSVCLSLITQHRKA